jgi:hypothetical protein
MEKKCTRTGRSQGSLFYPYLIYHHSCLDYEHTLTRLIDRTGCLRAYPLVFCFSREALVTNSNSFVMVDVNPACDIEILNYVICCGYPDPKSSLRGPPWEHNHTCVSVRSKHDTMLENRSHAPPRRSAPPREFFLPVDVYISNQAAAALRKVRLTYFATTYFPFLVHQTAQPAEKI